MENDEIIELTRYAHPAHAHNIKMLLESNGIRTFVKNFSVPDSLADGPYVVMVRESDVTVARKLMIAATPDRDSSDRVF